MDVPPAVARAWDIRRRLAEPLTDFLVSRVPLWLVMWFDWVFHHSRSSPTNTFLSGWFQWDADIYMGIADVGYDNIPDKWGHRDTAFWPLYPLLARGMRLIVPGESRFTSAFILSHLLLFGALVLFRDIAEWTVGRERARLSTWLLLAHPFAFLYSSAYSESCFLFFALLSFHFGVRKRWLVAGLAAACASATRAAGIGVTVALAVLYLEECNWSLKKIGPDAAFVALGSLGTLEYIGLLQLHFHDPFAFTSSLSAKTWGVDMTLARFLETLGAVFWPWREQSLSWIQAVDMLHIVCLGAATAATIGGRRGLRPYLFTFCAIELLMISQVWCNGGRYSAPLFPIYFVFSDWLEHRPNWTRFVVTLSLSFQAVLAFAFGQGDWVG